MNIKNSLQSNTNSRKYFYILSFIVFGMFIFNLSMPESVLSKFSTLIGLEPHNSIPHYHYNEFISLMSLTLFLSIIVFVLGLVFISKNWLVRVILITLILPHILLLFIFFVSSDGKVIETLEVYGFTLTTWMPWIH